MAKPSRGAGEGRGTRPAAHELARYEALFAARTRGMKSSAMREMMVRTEITRADRSTDVDMAAHDSNAP